MKKIISVLILSIFVLQSSVLVLADNSALETAINSLTLSETKISSQLTLPSEIGGYTISWTTVAPEIVLISGNVAYATPTAVEQNAVITATISDGSNSASKNFNVTVPSYEEVNKKLLLDEDFQGYASMSSAAIGRKSLPTTTISDGTKAFRRRNDMADSDLGTLAMGIYEDSTQGSWTTTPERVLSYAKYNSNIDYLFVNFDEVTSGKVVINYKYYVRNDVNGNIDIRLRSGHSASESTGTDYLRLPTSAQGITLQDGIGNFSVATSGTSNGLSGTSAGYVSNSWNKATIVADVTNKTYTFYLNDVITTSGRIAKSGASSIGHLMIGSSKQYTSFMLDSFEIYTLPETLVDEDFQVYSSTSSAAIGRKSLPSTTITNGTKVFRRVGDMADSDVKITGNKLVMGIYEDSALGSWTTSTARILNIANYNSEADYLFINFDEVTSGMLALSYKYYVANDVNKSFDIRLRSGNTSSISEGNDFLRIATSAREVIAQGSSGDVSIATAGTSNGVTGTASGYISNGWNEVTVVADVSNKTYSFYLNGELKASGRPARSTAAGLGHMMIGTSNLYGQIKLDDIKVYKMQDSIVMDNTIVIHKDVTGVTAEFRFKKDTQTTIYTLLAMYDNNHKLINVDYNSSVIEANTLTNTYLTLDYPDTDYTGYEVKGFIWKDLKTLVPVVETQSVFLQKDSIEANLSYYWDSKIMYNESLTMVENVKGELPEAPLLFTPKEIISVRNATLDTEYIQGKDWEYNAETNSIRLLPGSSAFYFDYDSYAVSGNYVANNGSGTVIAGGSDETYFHVRQLAVTYIHDGQQWQGLTPQYMGTLLPRTIQKLKNGENITMVMYGDSIAKGAQSSGYAGLLCEPMLPIWGQLVKIGLDKHYGTNINFVNPSVGGKDSAWGLNNVASLVNSHTPDLVIIAFGMNDGTESVSAQQYITNIQAIMDSVKSVNPDAEFILVSTMLPNPLLDSFYKLQPTYRQPLLELSQTGVTVLDMTQLHTQLLMRKRFVDMTGNNANHPNDFLARWYAQYALAMLIE